MKRRTRFRGDLQVDGSIVGSDGQPIDFGGGGSVDLEHLTELAFGEASDISLRRLTDEESSDLGGQALNLNKGLVIQDEDGDGLIVRDPWGTESIWDGGYTEIDTSGIYVQDSFGGGGANLTGDGLNLYGENSQISLSGVFGGNVGIDVYDARILLKMPSNHPDYGALMATRPLDGGSMNESSFLIDHAGAMHWGPEGALPWDVSLQRTAPGTLEIDHILSFKGDAGDPTSGVTLEWDQTWYGLLLKGRPGAGDSELYVVNPDDPNQFTNIGEAFLAMSRGIWPDDHMVQMSDYGISFRDQNHWVFQLSNYGVMQWGPGTTGTDTTLRRHAAGLLEIPQNGGGYIAHSPDGTAYKLTPPNGGGAATWVAA